MTNAEIHAAVRQAYADHAAGLNPATHRYDGADISVTEVLDGVGLGLGFVRGDLEFYRQRGQALHRAIELDAAGRLDDHRLDEVILYMVRQWRRWRDQQVMMPILAEAAVVHPLLRYGGKIDHAAALKVNGSWHPCAVDFKAGVLDRDKLALQTAGYCMALDPGLEMEWYRIGLGLNTETDEAQAEVFGPDSLREDAQAFCCALQVARWRRRPKQ